VPNPSVSLARVLTLALVAAVALLGLAMRERELGSARDLHAQTFETSASCTRCHVDHARSFGRTFHRTMTREARGTALKAPFAGEQVSYFDVPARMDKRPDGTPTMHFGGGAVPEQTFEIALTVGSRRYQQYIGKAGDSLVRLPWAYHIEEQRWFHMNGAFLTADPTPGPAGIDAADYTRHVTRWNDNCIFCHNVRPSPGLQRGPHDRVSFESHVEELGVACEACHGPASAHVDANADPYRRYRLHLSDAADPTIVNPRRLSQERSLDLCGRCHGQRITDDVSAFMQHGDPFVPGDDLALYSAPLWRDTSLAGQVGTFAPRFWADGTPRLTAYEYQGALLSPCSAGGKLTCLSCHDMHGGDPRGQLRADLSVDQLCTQCHQTFSSPDARAEHTHHDADRDAVRCVDCHMPSIVYGVMASHPSHRIEVPDPYDNQQRARPDACTLCHVTETRSWAIEQRERLWTTTRPARIAVAATGLELVFSQAELQLLSADPVTRALTAARFGRYGASTSRVTALLLDVMEHDRYPGVRHLAYRSLLERHPRLVPSEFEPEWPPPRRQAVVTKLRTQLAHDSLDTAAIEQLRTRADDNAIEIGE
jgi:predicted CXXCH cytochrome family protein